MDIFLFLLYILMQCTAYSYIGQILHFKESTFFSSVMNFLLFYHSYVCRASLNSQTRYFLSPIENFLSFWYFNKFIWCNPLSTYMLSQWGDITRLSSDQLAQSKTRWRLLRVYVLYFARIYSYLVYVIFGFGFIQYGYMSLLIVCWLSVCVYCNLWVRERVWREIVQLHGL